MLVGLVIGIKKPQQDCGLDLVLRYFWLIFFQAGILPRFF